MDWTYVWVILGTVVIEGLGILFTKVLKRKNVTLEQLVDGAETGKLLVAAVSAFLKIFNVDDEKVDVVADIILDSLEYIKSFSDDIPTEHRAQIAYEYAIDLCESFYIVLFEFRTLKNQ